MTAPNTASADGPSTRQILPTNRLPSGRAMLGAVFVTLAVLGIFVATGSGNDSPSPAYAVAARPIEPGTHLTAADVTYEELTLADTVAMNGFAATDDLVGAVAIDGIGAGELLQRTHVALAFSGVDEPSLEFSFPISRSRAPRTLRTGDAVAVLATVGSGEGARTDVVVADAIVIAFEADESGPATRTSAVLTVAIADGASQIAVAHAAQTADLTVVRTTKHGSAVLPTRYPGVEQ